jgi:putative flippase GtrA
MNEAFKWNYWVCYLTALTLSVLWNFTLNRKVTFHSASNVPIAMLKVAAYYLVFTPLSTWGGSALEAIGWNEYLVLVISMTVNFVTEFLFQRYVVFADSLDTAK